MITFYQERILSAPFGYDRVARGPEQIKRHDGPLAGLLASSSLQALFGCLPRLAGRAEPAGMRHYESVKSARIWP